MKKILISLLCAVFLFAIVPIKVDAESIENPESLSEMVQIGGNYYTKISEENVVYTDLSYYDESGDFVFGARLYNEIELSIIEPILPIEQISPFALIDDYDQWRGWPSTPLLQRGMDFTYTEQVTYDLILEAITSFLDPITSEFVNLASSLAQQYYNNRYGGLYCKMYVNNNLHCSILRHEQLKLYTNSSYTALLRTETEYGVWTGSPWDYTNAETACRVLTERYP